MSFSRSYLGNLAVAATLASISAASVPPDEAERRMPPRPAPEPQPESRQARRWQARKGGMKRRTKKGNIVNV